MGAFAEPNRHGLLGGIALVNIARRRVIVALLFEFVVALGLLNLYLLLLSKKGGGELDIDFDLRLGGRERWALCNVLRGNLMACNVAFERCDDHSEGAASGELQVVLEVGR